MNVVENYTRNPDQLLDLVREVIASLVAEDEKSGINAMEAQLREIARAVDNLEKANIAIPDALRAEKTRLASTVAAQSEAALSLGRLTVGLEEILSQRKSATKRTKETKTPRQTGRRRSRSPKTGGIILRELIIEALRYHSGSASKQDVHQYIEEKLTGKFLPGDLEWRESTGNHVWQNNTDWERFHMVRDGVLKQGSPIGTWELGEEYR
ncbi:MAG: hypothetical protein ACYC36_06785 [Bellilinea sp.]